MLQRYEKGGEKGASVRALAPDFFRHWSRFSSLPRFPAFACFSALVRFFSTFADFFGRSALLGVGPFPAVRFSACSSTRSAACSTCSAARLAAYPAAPFVPPFVLRSPWLVFSLRSILLPPVRHRLARCVRPCCPISSSAACCPAPSGPFLICSVPTCSAARPLFPLRYVPSRSLFRLRCVRPFLSACRRRPSGPPLSRARRRSSRVAAQTSAHSPMSPFYAFRHPFPAPLCALRSAAAPRNVFSAEKLPDSPGKNAKNHTSRFVTIFDCYFFHIPKSFYTFVPSNSVLRAAARRGAGRRPGPAPQCADDHRTKDLRFY